MTHRYMEILEGVRITFPRQSEAFCDGFEIGVLAMLLVVDTPTFGRAIAVENVQQARDLAEQFGYRVIVGDFADDDEDVECTFTRGPSLTVVK